MNVNEAFFEMGSIYGRIRQLCLDRGFVVREGELTLVDYISSISHALEYLPIENMTKEKINQDIKSLVETLSRYQEEEQLKDDDAKKILFLTNSWRDLMLKADNESVINKIEEYFR